MLATAAYLVGKDNDSADVWARAHHECLRRGDGVRAARCAFWLAKCDHAAGRTLVADSHLEGPSVRFHSAISNDEAIAGRTHTARTVVATGGENVPAARLPAGNPAIGGVFRRGPAPRRGKPAIGRVFGKGDGCPALAASDSRHGWRGVVGRRTQPIPQKTRSTTIRARRVTRR